jgi:hypothetical protein
MAEESFYKKDIHLEVVLLLNNCTSNKCSNTSKMCPTCLDSILNKYTITLKCNHEYHRNCILKEILKLGGINCVTCEIENYSRFVEQQELKELHDCMDLDMQDDTSSYELSLEDGEEKKDDQDLSLAQDSDSEEISSFRKFHEYQSFQDFDDIDDFSFLK